MARGINKVILIGNCGSDPDKRTTNSGMSVVTISLATTEGWKGQDGQGQERTEWHRLVFFDKLADVVGNYVTKGSKLYCEGRLQTREWDDKDGNKRYTTEVVVRDMQMLDGRGGDRPANNDSAADDVTNQSEATAPLDKQSYDDIDDDIPF